MSKRLSNLSSTVLRLLPWVGVLLFATGTLLRAIFLDISDGDYGLLNDHFIASVVAKNIAQGHGWVTTGHETFPLNPQSLNTGPTVVLPMALAITLFGNGLVVTSMAMAVLNVLLLFGLLWQSRFYWPNPSQHTLFMLSTLTLFACLWPQGWYRAGGEVTSALLLANAALLLARQLRDSWELDWKTALGAGLLAGLAATSKQLALLACAGLATAVLLFTALQHGHGWRNNLLLCLSMALPYTLFVLYQHQAARALDPVWWAGTEYYRTHLFEHYSGLETVKRYLDPQVPLWPEITTTFTRNLLAVHERIASSSAWPQGWLLWPAWFLCSLCLAWQQRQQNPLASLLLAAALPLLIWFFLIATAPVPRYLMLAACLTVLACLTAALTWRGTAWRSVAVITPVILCSTSNPNTHGWFLTPNSLHTTFFWPLQLSALGRTTQDMSRFLEANPELPVSMPSYININRLEYLSHRRNIFLNPLDELARHAVFDEAKYLKEFPDVAQAVHEGHYASGREHYLHPDTPDKYRGYFRLTQDVRINLLITHSDPMEFAIPPFCSSIVYQNAYHMIVGCNGKEIEHLSQGQLPQRPQLWLRPQRIYPSEYDFF